MILTSKVFEDNPDYPEHNLIAEIKNQLQVEQVILIPQEPNDFTGHADSMVRFNNENNVLVSSYPKDKTFKGFRRTVSALMSHPIVRDISAEILQED